MHFCGEFRFFGVGNLDHRLEENCWNNDLIAISVEIIQPVLMANGGIARIFDWKCPLPFYINFKTLDT